MRQSAARQFPDYRQSVPSSCLRVIEFFSHLVSKVVAIGQVKEIVRHGTLMENWLPAFRSFGFELQGPCSAFNSWRAHERDPKTFSLAAHNQELVLGHVTFVL